MCVKRLTGSEMRPYCHFNVCMDGNQLRLTTLDVGNNQIGVIENIAHLKGLEEFWVRPTGAPPASGSPAHQCIWRIRLVTTRSPI